MQPMQAEIKEYGWVPFEYFQHLMLFGILLSYMNYDKINNTLKKNIYEPIQTKYQNANITKSTKVIISLLPVLIIFYLDFNYSSFSMNNLGVTKVLSNNTIDTILKLFGAYCIIQVAAQDVGIKTGSFQADIVKLPWFQFIIYAGIAFTLTQNRSMSLIATLAYFQLKFFASDGITKDVCFE